MNHSVIGISQQVQKHLANGTPLTCMSGSYNAKLGVAAVWWATWTVSAAGVTR